MVVYPVIPTLGKKAKDHDSRPARAGQEDLYLNKLASKQASKQENKDKDIEVAAEWRDILMKYLLVYFFHRK